MAGFCVGKWNKYLWGGQCWIIISQCSNCISCPDPSSSVAVWQWAIGADWNGSPQSSLSFSFKLDTRDLAQAGSFFAFANVRFWLVADIRSA